MSLVSVYESPYQYDSEPDVPLVPTLAPNGIIVSHTFPASAVQGANLPFSFDVHNNGTEGQIAFGIANISGNPGNIVITYQGSENVLTPNQYWRLNTVNPVPNCFHIIDSASIRFESAGNYVIKLWGMWYNELTGQWTYNSAEEITKNITVQIGWPIEYPIHIFNNTKLNPGLLLEGSKTENISNVDTSVLLGGRVDYSITHVSAVLPGYDAKIFWNDVEKVTGRPIEGALSGSFDLTPFEIGPINTIKIYMKQGPAGYNVCIFDVYVTLGFSEKPAYEPKTPFNWQELIDKYGKWIGLGVAGLVILYMMKRPSIIVVGGSK